MNNLPSPQELALKWRPGMSPREYAQAKSARAEMLRNLSGRIAHQPAARKSWAERMTARTGKEFH